MLGTYYYHEIIRRTIIAFGTLFNNIEIKHKTQSGDAYSSVKVPIAYGPTEKFLARLEQKPDPRQRVGITLPRLAFEMDSIAYDNQRKVSTMQTFKAFTTDGSKARKVFMPVPYNLGFKLYAMTQYNEDSLQIIEQILPFFQPSFNLTVDLVKVIGEKRDIPMVLENVSFQDNYDSGMEEKRVIIYTLDFTAKTYLFGPVADNSEGIIKKVQVGYVAGERGTGTYTRDVTYSVTPKATKDYDGDDKTYVTENVDTTETVITVANAEALTVNTNIYVGQENIYIDKISGNDLTVKRGQYNTAPQEHVSGAKVYEITSADADLIEVGDDFGFDGNVF